MKFCFVDQVVCCQKSSLLKKMKLKDGIGREKTLFGKLAEVGLKCTFSSSLHISMNEY